MSIISKVRRIFLANIFFKLYPFFQQQAKFSISSKSLVHPGSPEKKTFLNLQLPNGRPPFRRPKTLLANGFIISRSPINGLMNKSAPNLFTENVNNLKGKKNIFLHFTYFLMSE